MHYVVEVVCSSLNISHTMKCHEKQTFFGEGKMSLSGELMDTWQDISLWLLSKLLTLSDWKHVSPGLYQALSPVYDPLQSSLLSPGWSALSPLIWPSCCDSITAVEPHRKISQTLRTTDVSKHLICVCFIDSGHLLIQLLVPPLVFVDAHRQGSWVPEETFSDGEMGDRGEKDRGREKEESGAGGRRVIFHKKTAGLSVNLRPALFLHIEPRRFSMFLDS